MFAETSYLCVKIMNLKLVCSSKVFYQVNRMKSYPHKQYVLDYRSPTLSCGHVREVRDIIENALLWSDSYKVSKRVGLRALKS